MELTPYLDYSNQAVDMHYKIAYVGPPFAGKFTNILHLSKVVGNSAAPPANVQSDYEHQMVWDGITEHQAALTRRYHCVTIPGPMLITAGYVRLLMGADGIVFIADSKAARSTANIEALRLLSQTLQSLRCNMATIPLVLQYNKRDLPGALSVVELDAQVNLHSWPVVESVAVQGQGVVETFQQIRQAILQPRRG